MAYEGTLLLITHDRYLMNSLACPILYIEDGKATRYESYEKLMKRGEQAVKQEQPAQEKTGGKASYGKEQRKRRAELRARLKAVEDEIESIGEHITDLETEISSPDVLRDHVLLQDKCSELEAARNKQQALYDEWEVLLTEQEEYEKEED